MITQEIKEKVLELKSKGLSSRKIAKELGIGKSSVNRLYKEYLDGNNVGVKKPKVLLIDIETMPSITATFGRFKQNISQDAVLREGGWIVSYAYKWLGDKNVEGNLLTPEEAMKADDSSLCMEIWELLEQADTVIGHNCNNFDLPIIKTRMIINGLPPIRKIRSLDTLVLAKEFRFNSNKLDSLCRQLDIGEKIKHEGMMMWVSCGNGEQSALNRMFEYNLKDVDILEELYLHIRPYSNRHPNLAVYYGDTIRCNICCSDNVKPTGNTVSTNLSVFEEYVCNDCQARFKTRQSITSKEERKNFLSN